MKRDLDALAAEPFDVLVIGGGIHGAFAAWEASLRGLRVALVERGDFASGTSANSLKIAHGGLRYLQRLDFLRMRRSSAERATLLRLAPQLVRPLGFLVPTRGAGRDSRLAFTLGLGINDVVTWDRNRGLPADRAIPGGRLLSRAECLARFPGFASGSLSGGALWYDGQVLHPERLVISVLHAAVAAGATVANYAEARDLPVEQGKVTGAVIADRVGGASVRVRSRAVINAAGPGIAAVAARVPPGPPLRFARSLNLVIRGRVADCAIGVRSRRTRTEDPVNGGERFMFCCPWRDHTLVGTSYAIDRGDGAPARLEEIVSLLDEINEACPALGFSLDTVTFFHWGLTPLKAGLERGRPTAAAERPRMVEHGSDGARGLVSVIGPKFTTARRVAVQAVNIAAAAAGLPAGHERTHEASLAPPDADRAPSGGSAARLAEIYGPHSGAVAALLAERADWTTPLAADTPVRRGEAAYAVRSEMAFHLGDLVFRRTELGTAEPPSAEALAAAAAVMGEELGWSPEQEQREILAVRAAYVPLPFASAGDRAGAPA